jgi:exodeoxyribonuclease V alpha subunit
MQTFNNVHQQFAEFFKSETLKPFAYLISKKLSEGHICLPLNDVEEEIKDAPFIDEKAVLQSVKKLATEPFVAAIDEPKQPFVLHNNRLYLQRYFNYETQILTRLKAFVETEKQYAEERTKSLKANTDFIQSLFPQQNSGKAANEINWQLVAAIIAVLNDFSIITGGPGTGKTTTVAKVLAILFKIDTSIKVALAAPTGKAAVRMAESLKKASLDMPVAIAQRFEAIIPGTIHRLLGYIPNSPYFKHNAENPVNFDVVIIDESSMIDVALFSKLLQAIGNNTRLILLGDKDQLASVEAGSLFGDLCNAQPAFTISAKKAELINNFFSDTLNQVTNDFIVAADSHLLFEHIVELKQSHRFSSDRGIGKLSKAIITNDEKVVKSFIETADSEVTIDTKYEENIFESFVKGYVNYIKETDIKKALARLNELRVLCAIREGEQGLYALNRKIEKYLQQKKLIKPNAEFYEHRPVIVTKNYYDLGLFNGDVGIIRPDENKVLKAWFEDSSGALKSVLPGFIAEAETVYAMTIHKSQGSEYDHVLVVLPDAPELPLLTAELLYTGVTRAKTSVVIQATEEVIAETAKRRVKRASGIMDRFDET